MCLNKYYITTKDGTRLLVKCGKCDACLQEKALVRTNKIRNNIVADSSEMVLFGTLTYSNDFVPYIDRNEFNNSIPYLVKDVDPDTKILHYVRNINVYRGSDVLYNISVPYGITLDKPFTLDKLPDLNGKLNSVGVVYYKDVQNFFKLLRINLKRKFNYDKPFRFFACTEYGETSLRPHIHFLLFVPQGNYRMWQRAVNESWPFDDSFRSARYLEIARNPSSYVSSYVNCFSALPYLFKIVKDFRPCAHYSKGFGLGKMCFTLPQVYQSFLSGSLGYDLQHLKDGALVVDNMLYPKYVVNRYFPKIKGYSRLNADSLFYVSERPQRLACFARDLSYSRVDLHTNIVRLLNAQRKALSNGLTLSDFAYAYSRIWSLYYSCLIKDEMLSVYTFDQWAQAYDNISDYLAGKVRSPTLDGLYISELNPNYFTSNVSKHDILVQSFELYRKDRKVRNTIYSKNLNF